MQDAGDLRPSGEPRGQRQALALGLAQTQLQAAQPTQGEEDILRPRAIGEKIEGRAQAREPAIIGGGEAEQQISVAGEIFGAGLDDEIDAEAYGWKNSGVAQVLSRMVQSPLAAATATIAGTS